MSLRTPLNADEKPAGLVNLGKRLNDFLKRVARRARHTAKEYVKNNEPRFVTLQRPAELQFMSTRKHFLFKCEWYCNR
jgi:hypothetical protein